MKNEHQNITHKIKFTINELKGYTYKTGVVLQNLEQYWKPQLPPEVNPVLSKILAKGSMKVVKLKDHLLTFYENNTNYFKSLGIDINSTVDDLESIGSDIELDLDLNLGNDNELGDGIARASYSSDSDSSQASIQRDSLNDMDLDSD
jgi:hypothetical protein